MCTEVERPVNWFLGCMIALATVCILTGTFEENGTRQLAKPAPKVQIEEVKQ
jgi:hypothetical protein